MATRYAASSSSPLNSGTWRALAWLGVALQAIAFIAVWWLQRWHGLWVIGIFFVLSLAFLLMKNRIPSLISFLVVCAAIVNAGGWAWDWYDSFIWFDELVHTFTPFAVVSAMMSRLLTGRSMNNWPGAGACALWAALIGLGLGIAWEILEAFFLNLMWLDTLIDIVLDTIGSALGGWFVSWMFSQRAYAQAA